MPQPSERQLRVARRVANGEARRSAMIAEGYSPDYAVHSIRSIAKTAPAWLAAFQQAAEELALTPEQIKKMAEFRLVRNMVDGKDRAVSSIRALGEMRGHDWYPRAGVNVDVQFAQTIAPIVQELAAEVEKKDS